MITNATPAATRQKLLIIEDEGEMCLLINLLLDGQGYDVEHVWNLARAVEYFQQQPPDVVLLDNRLPDGFGLDFIGYVKQHWPSTKIIMITGADPSARDVAMENGAEFFLEKPFNKVQLCRALESV